MNRRSFLRTTLGAGGALAAGAFAPATLSGARIHKANDVVLLGPDKVRVAQLAIGTGTRGGRPQRALGVQGLADMLHYGYDQGLFWWDTADSYRTHPHVREALTRTIPLAPRGKAQAKFIFAGAQYKLKEKGVI
jgi:hypothetical protein